MENFGTTKLHMESFNKNTYCYECWNYFAWCM